MKKNGLVVFVTRTGHARQLAAMIGKETSFPVAEIGDKVDRKGFFGFMKAGFQAVNKKATPISDPGVSLADKNIIILVQPIWASSIVPPLRTWLQSHTNELTGKKIALLVTNKGGPVEKLKIAFETEFWPLTALASIPEKTDDSEMQRILREFLASLERY